MLKVYDEDSIENTIGGLQRMSEDDVNNSIVKRVLEEFALQGGTGHLNLVEGDVVGTFTDTYWPVNYTESIVKDDFSYNFISDAEGWVFHDWRFGLKTDRSFLGTYSIGVSDGETPSGDDSFPTIIAHVEPPDLEGGELINRLEFAHHIESENTTIILAAKTIAGNNLFYLNVTGGYVAVTGTSGSTTITREDTVGQWVIVKVYLNRRDNVLTLSLFDQNENLLESKSDNTFSVDSLVDRFEFQRPSVPFFVFSGRFDRFRIEYETSDILQTDTNDIYQHWEDPGNVSLPYALMDYKVGSLEFDGVDDYINTGERMSFSNDESFTVEGWIYQNLASDNNNFPDIIGKGFNYEHSWLIAINADGGLTFTLRDSNSYIGYGIISVSTVIALPEKTWIHVAAVRDIDQQQIRIYLDGSNEGTTSTVDLIHNVNNSINVHLGSRPNDSSKRFRGNLRDWRIWGAARTQTQIQNNMNSPASGSESNLLGYWPLDGSWENQATITPNVDTSMEVAGTTWSFLTPFPDPGPGHFHELSDEEITSKIIDKALKELTRTDTFPIGTFRFFDEILEPYGLPGSWEVVGGLIDRTDGDETITYNTDGADYPYTRYRLLKKISNGGPTNIFPLKLNTSLGGLQKVTAEEIEHLVDLLKKRIYETGIGRYAFSVNAPSEGSWVIVSTVNDELAEIDEVSYAREYQEATYYGSTQTTYYGSTSRSWTSYSYLGTNYGTYYVSTRSDYYGSTVSGGSSSTKFFTGEIVTSTEETITQYKLWLRIR